MTTSEIPRRQTHFFHEFNGNDFERYGTILKNMLKEIPKPQHVSTVLDLYCGNGVLTAGALHVFPESTVHCVDIHNNVLSPTLAGDPRVVFHQGWVSEQLKTPGGLPKAELVIIGNAGRLYGLENEDFDALKRHVNGYLLTLGDNMGMESQEAFRRNFLWFSSNSRFDAAVWLPSDQK